MPETFGDTLKRIRRPRGTQKEIATRIPMDLGYFSKLENDKLSYPPSRETVNKIADALKCTPEETNELLSAAGRIDQEIEDFARIANKHPEMRRLFKAVTRLDGDLLEELLNELDPLSSLERQKGVEVLSIHAPAPSKYVSHQVVEEVATQCVLLYRKKKGERKTYRIDPSKLVEILKISLKWEAVEEPENAIFFACYTQHGTEGEIVVNKKHRKFFETRPDVYRATLGHEIGHCILNHHNFGSFEGTRSLFPELEFSLSSFHKPSWFPYGLSHAEVERLKILESKVQEKLVKKATVNEKYRDTLRQMNNKFELEWMFRQAEHFSRCLLIPKDRILDLLEGSWDLSSWATLYRWAEMFEVPTSMMRVRLEKMGVIEIGTDGKPHLTEKAKQKGLF
jgi:transcriptional regulator with XRE-family HTH domain/Zn-dependent peptidase ImmA (M78 family)